MKGRRVLSVILALCMLLTVIPFTALAQESTVVTTWAQLQDALNEGGDITLGADITAGASDTALVAYSERAVLDLNGLTIDRALSEPTADGSVFVVYGFLRIDGPGTITGGCMTGYGGGILIKGDGAVNMYGATITGNGAVGPNNKSGAAGSALTATAFSTWRTAR